MNLVTVRPGLTLEAEAAASWARMEHEHGGPLDVNRSTVSDAEQQQKYDEYQAYLAYQRGGPWAPWAPLALPPDKSWHSQRIARATDTDDHEWVRAHPDHGWRFVVKGEVWHAQYYPELDHYRGQGFPAGMEDDVSAADVTEALYGTRVTEEDGAARNLFDQNARLRGEVRAQFATLRAAIAELSGGGITAAGLERIEKAAREGAEKAADERYKAQIAGLQAQLDALRAAG